MVREHLHFIKDKILSIQTAIFYSLNRAVLKLPNMIVSAFDVDDVGNVWFLIPRPQQRIEEFDREFPSHLQFYRKGKPFFLKVWGKACIITDPEEIAGIEDMPAQVKSRAMEDMILVKVYIHDAVYQEEKVPFADDYVQNAKTLLNRWLFRPEAAFELRARPILTHS